MRAAARLVEMGYFHVFEYPGGTKEWQLLMGGLEREPPARAPQPPPPPSPA